MSDHVNTEQDAALLEAITEYHWTERRAELLQLIETAGHPDSISPTRLADRYDVSEFGTWGRAAQHVEEEH